MEIRKTKLQPAHYYHIFNRGINGEKIFFEQRNYTFFLERYTKYVYPFVDTFAYCLLGNHFHLLIRVRSDEELEKVIKTKADKPSYWHVSNAFSSFLQSYTRAINKAYGRTGAIFETPFKRIEVKDEAYFTSLVNYIHQNPEKHGLISDFRDYEHSSYHTHLSRKVTKLSREDVIAWFGDKEEYVNFHALNTQENLGEIKLEGLH